MTARDDAGAMHELRGLHRGTSLENPCFSPTGTIVTAVVIDYHAAPATRAAVASLRTFLRDLGDRAEIVVVDNGAAEGADPAIDTDLRAVPAVRWLPQDRNHGFAGGAAAGIDASSSEWILLLNNDAEFSQGSITDLLDAARGERVGAVCPVMVFKADPERINSAGIVVDENGVARDGLLGQPVAGLPRTPFGVWGCSGGAAMYSRAMLDAIGGFDREYFMYYEDVDVAWRAQVQGWSTRCCPSVRVVHEHSATSQHASAFKLHWCGRNRVRLLAQNLPAAQLRRRFASIVGYELLYVAYYAARHRTTAPLRGRIAGLRDWRTVRVDQPAIALPPSAGVRAALRRNRAVRTLGSGGDQKAG